MLEWIEVSRDMDLYSVAFGIRKFLSCRKTLRLQLFLSEKSRHVWAFMRILKVGRKMDLSLLARRVKKAATWKSVLNTLVLEVPPEFGTDLYLMRGF